MGSPLNLRRRTSGAPRLNHAVLNAAVFTDHSDDLKAPNDT